MCLRMAVALDTSKKLRNYIESNNITCVLNNAKWNNLFEVLKEIESVLDFQRKDLDEDAGLHWDSDIYHIFGGYQYIEWLNIRAMTAERQGALMPDKVTNHIDLLLVALKQTSVPYSIYADGVRVWGYLREGNSVNWQNT